MSRSTRRSPTRCRAAGPDGRYDDVHLGSADDESVVDSQERLAGGGVDKTGDRLLAGTLDEQQL